MSKLIDLIKAQPVYTMGLIQAAIALSTSFGLNLSGQQIGSIMLFSAALLSFILQQVVTPVAAPSLPVGAIVSVVGSEDKVEIESQPTVSTGSPPVVP